MKPLSQPAFVCASCARMLRSRIPKVTTARTATVSAGYASVPNGPPTDPELPRYRQTPPAMKMPFRLRPQPQQPVWRVNRDQEKLDTVYDKFLMRVGGSNVPGRDLLDDQTKWIAVTHKSFDHGRQGFNDRLAYLGKRVVELQTSLALLDQPTVGSPFASENSPSWLEDSQSSSSSSSSSSSEVFQHPALEGMENMTEYAKHATLSPKRLAALASRYGLDKVVRWKPKKSDNLQGSGVDIVMAHAMYSVIGAVAMRNGGEVAAKAVREKILQPLGLR